MKIMPFPSKNSANEGMSPCLSVLDYVISGVCLKETHLNSLSSYFIRFILQ